MTAHRFWDMSMMLVPGLGLGVGSGSGSALALALAFRFGMKCKGAGRLIGGAQAQIAEQLVLGLRAAGSNAEAWAGGPPDCQRQTQLQCEPPLGSETPPRAIARRMLELGLRFGLGVQGGEGR